MWQPYESVIFELSTACRPAPRFLGWRRLPALFPELAPSTVRTPAQTLPGISPGGKTRASGAPGKGQSAVGNGN
jgi:hypothetical protein